MVVRVAVAVARFSVIGVGVEVGVLVEVRSAQETVRARMDRTDTAKSRK